jgi:hypothetical protein
VSPTVVTQNGGRFTVTATGQCTAGSQIAVVDGNGATVSVTASNALSDVAPPPTPTPTAFTVAPSAVTLNTCQDVANVLLIGGSGTYLASSGHPAIEAFSSGAIKRKSGSAAPLLSTVTVSFSDGKDVRDVTVNLTGDAQNAACP